MADRALRAVTLSLSLSRSFAPHALAPPCLPHSAVGVMLLPILDPLHVRLRHVRARERVRERASERESQRRQQQLVTRFSPSFAGHSRSVSQ